MNLRQAAEMACATLDHAAAVADRPGLMGMCEQAAEILRAALAEADEPVAWFESPYGEVRVNPLYKFQFPSSLLSWQIPLYTHPPRREPLTDEAIRELWSWASTHEAEKAATTQQHAFARAVERAHGIGGDE